MATMSTTPLTLPEGLPAVWVSRLSIFRSDEDNDPIRSVELTPGLNVIWGMDQLTSEQVGKRRGPGNNVGKSTFVRLIRYCLGDLTFAKRKATAQIKSMFPKGYAGIIVYVAGEPWSVIRPFNEKLQSRASRHLTLEELLFAKKADLPYNEFLEAVREATTRRMGVPEDDDVSWRHLLAWCSRDQEARYCQFSEWRVPESEGRVAVSKESAIRLMRVIFGLDHENQAALTRQIAEMRKSAAEARRAAQDRRDRLKQRKDDEFRRLANLLGTAVANLSEESDFFSIAAAVKTSQEAHKHEMGEIRGELTILNEQAWNLVADLQAAQDSQQTYLAILDASRKAEDDLSVSENDIDTKGICRKALKPYTKCVHIKELQDQLRQEREDASGVVTPSGSRHQNITALLEKVEAVIADLEKQKQQLMVRRDEILLKHASLDRKHEDLQLQLDVWTRSKKAVEDISGDRIIQDNDDDAARKEAKAVELEEQLQQLTVSQVRRVTALGDLFDKMTTLALAGGIHGRLRYSKGTFCTHIMQDEELAGEAFGTTLQVLLFDLMTMISGCLGLSHHPGLLIHDSSREADMGQSLYDGILEMIAWLCAGRAKIPFQYIVTTTSTPPQSVPEKCIRLRLDCAEDEHMLFKERLRYVDLDEHIGVEEPEFGLNFSPEGENAL